MRNLPQEVGYFLAKLQKFSVMPCRSNLPQKKRYNIHFSFYSKYYVVLGIYKFASVADHFIDNIDNSDWRNQISMKIFLNPSRILLPSASDNSEVETFELRAISVTPSFCLIHINAFYLYISTSPVEIL
jgi:hypothetical protein